ncbi:MAG: UDP-N-acetylmuramate dehydrogenase [Spirochaetaceae bacterium]|nr:UDP-N-acetylmuramate dehydrogenase [Spirochaetaceae bacterium]
MAKITESLDMFNIKGIVILSEPMWRHSTFMVGGAAEIYAVPSEEEDLRRLFTVTEKENTEIFILGGGSNILVADSGIQGMVIDTRLFNEYRLESGNSEGNLILGAGLPVSDAAWKSGSSGLEGLDFLFGMPGSVGGALWMNARCYDVEIAEKVAWIEVMDRGGRVTRLPMNRDEWGYKHSPFQTEAGAEQTLLRAAFSMKAGESEKIKASMREKRNDRESKGHYKAPCAGSAFKNNRAFGAPSGVLIDNCGLKGRKIGGASVAPWHANIIINDGTAKAADIRSLLEEVAGKVEETTGFRMEMEVLMVGGW